MLEMLVGVPVDQRQKHLHLHLAGVALTFRLAPHSFLLSLRFTASSSTHPHASFTPELLELFVGARNGCQFTLIKWPGSEFYMTKTLLPPSKATK